MLSYIMPTNINFGRGCLMKLAEALKASRAENILIFTGAKSAETSGALRQVRTNLPGNCNVIVSTNVKPNPTIASLKTGIGLCRKENIDVIIAIGGGSVIDYGKAVSILSKENGKTHDFFYKKHKLKGAKVKFIAVSTTFGTSSEITPFAVMTDEQRRTKVTLSDKSMFPNYAFTDPGFTLTMPGALVAASCLDLFSHAIEAYWSVNATELTDSFAAEAIKILLEHYRKAFQAPRDLRARERVSLAGLYAGLAFSNTGTTACHAVSYSMTVIFNIPHGIACGLTLGEVLELNSKTSKDKILKLSKIMGCRNVKEAKERVDSVLNNLQVKTRLSDYGLARNDLKVILDKGFITKKMANNPHKVTKQDLKQILERIY